MEIDNSEATRASLDQLHAESMQDLKDCRQWMLYTEKDGVFTSAGGCLGDVDLDVAREFVSWIAQEAVKDVVRFGEAEEERSQ